MEHRSTHGDIVKLVQLLKRPEATRDSVENILRNRLLKNEFEDAEEILEDSINCAMRLLLIVPTGGFLSTGRSFTVSGETKLSKRHVSSNVWLALEDQDLISFRLERRNYQRICKKKEPTLNRSIEDHVKLEKFFNARNLERIAGIKFRWTSNLADHLRMRDEGTVVEIFHYASFLRLHQNWYILPQKQEHCNHNG